MQPGIAAQQNVRLGLAALANAHDIDARSRPGPARVASILVGDVDKKSQEPVIVSLGERVLLMVVAACAVDRQAQENLAGRGNDAVQAVIAGQLGVGGLVVPEPQPVKAGGDQRFGRARVDLVAGDLLAEKLIIRLVFVEGPDYVVAIAPGMWLGRVAS